MQWRAVDTWAVGRESKQPRRVHGMACSLVTVAVLAVSLMLLGCADDEDEDGAADGTEFVNIIGARANLNAANADVVDGLTFTLDPRAFATATSVRGRIMLSFANIVDTDGDGDFDTGTFTATSRSGETATGTISFATNPFTLDADADSTFPNDSGLGPDDLFTCSTSAAICRIDVTANGPVPVGGPPVIGTVSLVIGPATTLQAFTSLMLEPPQDNISVDAAGNVFINGADSGIDTALP